MVSFNHKEMLFRSYKWLPGWFILIFISNCIIAQEVDTVGRAKPFIIHGTINLNLVGYGVNGIPSRADPFSAILSANVTAKLHEIELPISLVMANLQKSYAQSFNQVGISPRWKWITLHGGYRNVNFSNFTLAGHTFLGGGVELSPGLFRFGFIYGRFDRKTTANNVNTADTLPHYARKGFAVKLGVGNEKNFFDLLVLRIRDDSTSLHQADTAAITTPEQNVVAGINSHFTFVKKLTWDLEGAISLYTTNLGAQQIDDIEKDQTLSSLNKFLSVNFSSEYYYAARSALQYKEKNWSVRLEYKRIEPRYRSMGAYFFNNDVENITFSPAFALFRRKLAVNGSVGLQKDNLRNTKRATSARTIGNVNISCNPNPKFGFSAAYGNYRIDQRAGRIPLNDTTKVRQATHNFSFTPRLFLIKPGKSHMLMLVYNLAACRDKNEFTSDFTRFTSHIAQLNYILGLTESKWSVNTGFTYSLTSNFMTDITGIGGTIGVSKILLKDKLMMSWNNALTRTKAGQSGAWVLNSTLSSNYKAGKHHSFRLYIYFTGNYTGAGSVNPSYNEFKGDFSYVFTF
jgi:hypothetical protein